MFGSLKRWKRWWQKLFIADACMNDNDSIKGNHKRPIVYACSGCSDAGELADRVARELNNRGVCEMSCLAGIGGRVKPLMIKAQKAERIVVIDGCPLNCARHTLLGAGFENFQHIALHQLGHRKGDCPVTQERVEAATAAVSENLLRQKL